ncbi:MAG TPA: Rieske (2Fe-2S) protein [Nitrospirota bacterium]|nr:Rieske (2Fe-2S) protein [Nitrospirota bacterium]
MEEKKETLENTDAGHAEEGHPIGKCLATRRNFLGAFAGVVGAVGAGVVGVPLLASFKPVQRGKPEPAVLNLADIPAEGSVQGVFGGNPFLAFNRKTGIECVSLVCSHLGCLVKWDPATQKFKCPCHDGTFDLHGEKPTGPPPGPLEKLPFKIAGEKLIVGGA